MHLNGYIVLADSGVTYVGDIIEELPVRDLKSYKSGVLWYGGGYGTLFTGTDNNARRAALRAIARTKAYYQEIGMQPDWINTLQAVPVYESMEER